MLLYIDILMSWVIHSIMKDNQHGEIENSVHFTRIERLLDYIHAHIDQTLTVELLAEKSCWSRWQLQRIFLKETKQTVAQYVREIKLSHAAEKLLLDKERVMDIALNCGFNSEVSFIRAFKQLFHCTPTAYRRRGHRIGLKTPIMSTIPVHQAYEIKKILLQIRFEHALSFHFYGVCGQIQGLFSEQPNYAEVIPTIWHQMANFTGLKPPFKSTVMGIIDTRKNGDSSSTPYWAGYKVEKEQLIGLATSNILHVPEQTYAVLPHTGPVHHLDLTLQWFLSTWLAQSNYKSAEGFDLEIYNPSFDVHNVESTMECWIPILPK